MRCTGYEMARYKGTQASHLYEKSMHTLCTISEQPLLAEAYILLLLHGVGVYRNNKALPTRALSYCQGQKRRVKTSI